MSDNGSSLVSSNDLQQQNNQHDDTVNNTSQTTPTPGYRSVLRSVPRLGPDTRVSRQEITYRKHNKTFPQKLYEILDDPELSEIISWLPSGRHWKVHNRQRFENELMEQHFKSTKWKSFLRQVTIWGFQRGKLDTKAFVT